MQAPPESGPRGAGLRRSGARPGAARLGAVGAVARESVVAGARARQRGHVRLAAAAAAAAVQAARVGNADDGDVSALRREAGAGRRGHLAPPGALCARCAERANLRRGGRAHAVSPAEGRGWLRRPGARAGRAARAGACGARGRPLAGAAQGACALDSSQHRQACSSVGSPATQLVGSYVWLDAATVHKASRQAWSPGHGLQARPGGARRERASASRRGAAPSRPTTDTPDMPG